MIDGCGREIDHLRLSITDHCNLACRYCIGEDEQFSGQMIDPAFAYEVARWLVTQHGIRHIRVTGGEPLLHPDVIDIVARLAQLDTLREVTLTTNATALAQHAMDLHAAGLSRLNISLDTLDPDRFAHATRGGKVAQTLAGVEAAVAIGITPVKINVVVQRGFNDHELADIAAWGMSLGCVVRFLEVMEIGPLAHVRDQHLVPAADILERLRDRFTLTPILGRPGQPAVDYAATAPGVRGVIGIIAPTTIPFCDRCRRLRVTSRGRIVACVHDSRSFDIGDCWENATLDTTRADAALKQAVMTKPAEGPRNQSLTMLSMGG